MSRLGIRTIFLFVCGLMAIIASSGSAIAHPARMASAIATVKPDGEVRVALSFDVPAFLLNDIPARVTDAQMLALIDGPTELLERKVQNGKKRLIRAVCIIADGQEIAATVIHFPTAVQIVAASQTHGTPRLPVTLKGELSVQLPVVTKEIQFRISDVLDTLILTVERDGYEGVAFPLQAGMDSAPVSVSIIPIPAKANAAVMDRAAVSWRLALEYVSIGFGHILPKGLDHVLFVLGLFLLSPKLKPLFTQVTCFTVAHSITLALAMFGMVHVPGAIIEPIIAASIAFIAIENLWTTKLKPWRPIVIFVFGLVHGLGFAGVLQEMALPKNVVVPVLISFNLGVELGQLAVIAGAFVVVGWARNREWYRGVVVWPASIAIALMGLYWTVERVFV